MRRTALFAALAPALALVSAGCVPVEKYKAVELARDGLQAQLARAQTDVNSAEAKAASYRQQLAALQGNASASGAMGANLEQQNAQLRAQLADQQRLYDEMLARVGQGGALPAALTGELSRFADENPDLVEFDAERGIVKFKSDLTFASGSAELQPNAKTGIDRLAAILTGTAASYDLMVAGHTDNKPVGNPQTRQRHPNNWYLSSHRAISVAEEMIRQRVQPGRVSVAGFADQRPVAGNDSPAGMAQNRRVEVMILPSRGTPATRPAAQTVQTPPPARPVETASTPIEDTNK